MISIMHLHLLSRRLGLALLSALVACGLLAGAAVVRSAAPEQATGPAPARLTVAVDPALPERVFNRLLSALVYRVEEVGTATGPKTVYLLDRPQLANALITMAPLAEAGDGLLVQRFYAPVVPFATVTDEVAWAELAARWRGAGQGALLAPQEERFALAALFGAPPADTVAFTRTAGLLPLLEADPNAVGLLPFHQLDPRFKVLAVDGVSVLDNHLDPAAYPLAAAVTVQGEEAAALAAALAPYLPETTNRDPARFTSLIMTGVTAMSRVTAAKMERNGYTYPALIISDTLRAADITHVSNEVPFLDDCVVNAAANNLVLCSHTNYWAALEALGTDIVGLSGNHVNDFGRDGARRSIGWYREQDIPIYGSGLNVEEACAPLLWEHNGNRFAFLAALAFEPSFAWATEDQPGACYYYDNKERIFATIAELRPKVDIIAVELQYLETYNPYPTAQQVKEFRELRDQGVDIVTGVQSHVPQAMEPYGPEPGRKPGIIVYGLGNLFFDQMWSWQTRTELMARHAIYEGRLISTEILTAVLEDWAQPRWAAPEERAEILQRIFDAAPAR
ncbi:MAG: CapA family protein [Caldilineae bacterium]|nr:MAG: CapA family protein [Caldilineae bacterium]